MQFQKLESKTVSNTEEIEAWAGEHVKVRAITEALKWEFGEIESSIYLCKLDLCGVDTERLPVSIYVIRWPPNLLPCSYLAWIYALMSGDKRLFFGEWEAENI